MIRREESGVTWVIHQAAHAFVAGRIAEHWVGSGEMTYSPRAELLVAAYDHDSGWAIAEQAPSLNAQGQPRTFTEMPLEDHFAIWDRSITSVTMQNRYAGLLVSLHCTALYEQRLRYVQDTAEQQMHIQAFLDRWTAWQQDQIAALNEHPCYSRAVQPDQLAENVRLLQVWDYLSLLLGMSVVHEQPLDDIPLDHEVRGSIQVAAGGPRTMVLAPFPLDKPVTVWIDARRVEGGPFETDQALRTALAVAPYESLAFELVPGEPGNR